MGKGKRKSRNILAGLGPRLARARKAAGLTQAELAGALGCNRVTVARMETNRQRPSLEAFVAICRRLAAPAGEILGLDPEALLDPEVRDLARRIAAIPGRDRERVRDILDLIERAHAAGADAGGPSGIAEGAPKRYPARSARDVGKYSRTAESPPRYGPAAKPKSAGRARR